MTGRWNSLQAQLALRLTLLYLAVMAIGVGVLIYQTYATADSLIDRELARRAEELAALVVTDPPNPVRLALPTDLDALYHSPAETRIFAVRDSSGQIIAVSNPMVAELVAKWPIFVSGPDHFRLEEFGSFAQDYYGLSTRIDSSAGKISVMVARVTDAGTLVHTVIEDFLIEVAWILPLLVIATLLAGVFALRRGLRPLREASARAAAIGPGNLSVRLPEADLPNELQPLAAAINHALDRLQQSFTAQRSFTANAAHELRTPLAIVTAGLEALPGSEPVDKLRADVSRMNRLVDQLLRAARLDADAPDVTASVDLCEIASDVVAYMAPWAVAQERMISLDARHASVMIRGNAAVIADAIRNLVENAVAASPRGSEVNVRVGAEGSIAVADHGSGVPLPQRPHVFERFWRGQTARSGGAGLGLAIVADIMRLHGGRVELDDNPGGGAVFRLIFRTAQ